ncbi:autotransporter domain-containing protein [Calothrix sp. NIES-3974]|uniref:autotransporter domain-containing protein n=1 Tax=Calothrix sp. NIES-3974 TaxID=2005462 RepID=UPI000B60EF0C|nr:autotransporter domain-containing protein [Calothrix sp. NIES-3974]BAZ03882.1 outer membrane autotransporter barrel domain protein [Calothrix sp. NIES-3974]
MNIFPQIKKILPGIAVASIMTCCLFFTQTKVTAQPFPEAYIFGDSLSDDGNLFRITEGQIPPPPYFQGRFTNGFIWVERLEALLELDPNQTTNFALGGATSGTRNTVVDFPLGLQTQIGNFVSTPGQANSQALYIIWIGSNDYLGLRATDTTSVINNITGSINALKDKGARNFLVVNLLDLGKTVQENALGTAVSSTALTNTHNSELQVALQGLAQQNRNLNIIPLDVNALLSEVLAEPGKFGFTNLSEPCFNREAGTVCNNPNEYLFWDFIHPTARGHQLIGEYAAAVINAPQTIIPQSEIALGIAQRQTQLIDSRLQALQIQSSQPTNQPWGTFVNGNINFGDRNSSNDNPGYDFTTSGVTVGVDYRVADNLAVGVAFGLVGNETNFNRNRGKLESNGYGISLYSNYSQTNFWTNAILSYGNNDFDINRKTNFDNRTATATTNTSQFSASLKGGYIVRSGNLAYGPILGVRYDRVNIDGYTETGAQSLNLKVNDQNAEAFTLSIGAQAAVEFNTGSTKIIPHLRVSYERELGENTRTITTELLNQPGIPRRINTPERDKDYLKLGVGTQVVFSQNFAGAIDYETVIGRENFSDNLVRGEIRYSF